MVVQIRHPLRRKPYNGANLSLSTESFDRYTFDVRMTGTTPQARRYDVYGAALDLGAKISWDGKLIMNETTRNNLARHYEGKIEIRKA